MKFFFALISLFIITQSLYPHGTPRRHNSCACIDQINLKKKLAALATFSIAATGCTFASMMAEEPMVLFKVMGGITGSITLAILADILFHACSHTEQHSLKDGIGS